MSDVSFLLVTCCLDESRANVLTDVVKNLSSQYDGDEDDLTVFDNSSTIIGTHELLTNTFKNVYVADVNVGYWSAIDWWLESIEHKQPKYTYIIESDMIHYDFHKIWDAAKLLTNNDQIGSVRLHEYSVENWHLYNKDNPTKKFTQKYLAIAYK